jgi:hypothetical protein
MLLGAVEASVRKQDNSVAERPKLPPRDERRTATPRGHLEQSMA